MSLHYLLDGYNLIKQNSHLAALTLEDGRRTLIQWINVQKPQGSSNNAVTIVFDGQADVWGPNPGGCVRVIFTEGESADDKIKRIVEQSPHKKNFVVVSNDKDIVLYARALGAKVLTVQAFMAHATTGHRQHKGSQASAAEGKNISSTQADRINQELSKLWLKEK